MSDRLIPFNVNDHVRVKLTDFGRGKLREQYAKMHASHGGKIPLQQLPEEDNEGWSRWQMWHLMQSLGQYCHCGMANQPFESNILIETKA